MGTMFVLIAAVLSITIHFVVGDLYGYYWRDFDGSTPRDAYAGGRDENDMPIYIGQAHAANYLIPSKIYYNEKAAYFEYGHREFEVKRNLKILCTNQPKLFEWILTNNEDIHFITDKDLVIGGNEPGCTTYIGRIRYNGEVLVGKALTDNKPQHAGLYVTKNKVAKKHTTFEVLSFKWPKQNKTTG